MIPIMRIENQAVYWVFLATWPLGSLATLIFFLPHHRFDFVGFTVLEYRDYVTLDVFAVNR